MIELEKMPTIDKVVAMIDYTEARIEMEPNPLGVYMLKDHLRVYNAMADVILSNVMEVTE